uniref:G-protein coupled receptor 55-like n=1 Tax=Pristiophorus japonicus TaxID=55135 RepID=UPI00398F541A
MNCSISVTAEMKLLQLGMYMPTFLLGITFNAMALWAFCWKFRKWTETIIYMANLSVADTLLLLSLPFKMYSYRHPWKLGLGFCAFLECLYFVNMYVSIYIIVCISVDRYIAIKHPLQANRFRSPMKAAITCGATWIFVCLIRIFLQVKVTTESKNHTICFLKKTEKPTSVWIIVVIELLGFLIPSFILSYCSFHIIMIFCKRTMESQKSTAFSRSIIIVATNLIIFFICYVPFHAGILLQFLTERLGQDCEMLKNVRAFINVSICLANMNCCLNAIIYYFASVEVRDYFNYSKRKSSSKNANLCVISVQNIRDRIQVTST